MLHNELGEDGEKRLWLDDKQSMDDFRQAISDAQMKYSTKPKSEAQKWLGVLSAKVMHYAPVLDVLAQINQSYSSIIWGVMKFLFLVRRCKLEPLQEANTNLGRR